LIASLHGDNGDRDDDENNYYAHVACGQIHYQQSISIQTTRRVV
jgi:hypothetical protein